MLLSKLSLKRLIFVFLVNKTSGRRRECQSATQLTSGE